jgi:tetratricopeptide (TPR) repeat protein/DNA-binding CsgD family transcriptional regulator
MTEAEEQLRRSLAEASDTIEKLDLMLRLASTTRQSDPAAAHKLASKALRLARTNNDSLRITRSTIVLAFCEYYQTNYPAALKHFQKAMARARELDEAAIEARTHYGVGISYNSMGDFPQAMAALMHALELAEAHGVAELLGHIHNGIGMVFAHLGDFIRALEHYQHGLESFEALQDSAGELLVLNNLGCVYKALGDDRQAVDSFVRSNALAINKNDARTQAYTMINIGELLHRQGKPDEALEHYNRVLELGRVLGDTNLEASALSSMAAIHINRIDGDLNTALRLCQQAVEIAERTGNGTIWQYLVRVGEIHHVRMDYDRALEYYQRALEGTRTQGDRFSEYQILSCLAQCHEAMGGVSEAFRYHKLHTTLKEEVVGRQQQQEMMQFRIRLEIERAEKDREILRLEKLSLQQQMEHRAKELAATALHVVEKNEFLDSLKREISEVARVVDGKVRPALRGLMRQVDARINDGEDWDAFERQFELVHHDFIRSLSQRCPALTKTELKVCALLRINLTTKEIANILSTSTKTIDAHRYYIRRKLDIPSPTRLSAYFAAF